MENTDWDDLSPVPAGGPLYSCTDTHQECQSDKGLRSRLQLTCRPQKDRPSPTVCNYLTPLPAAGKWHRREYMRPLMYQVTAMLVGLGSRQPPHPLPCGSARH